MGARLTSIKVSFCYPIVNPLYLFYNLRLYLVESTNPSHVPACT